MQVKQLLEQQFPGIEVLGSTYPLSAGRRALAQAVGAAQISGLALVLAGDRLFVAAGAAAPPEWYARIAAARPTWALGVWLVGNMASSSVSSTGAFEIYFHGQLLYSKLAAGRLPSQPEWDALVRGIHAALTGPDAARAAAADAAPALAHGASAAGAALAA